MVTHIVFDFAYVLLFPVDTTYKGKLGRLSTGLASDSSYSPLETFKLNTELLEYLRKFKGHCKFSIFTSGRLHSLPAIKKELVPLFTNFFTESDLGYSKNSIEAFKKLVDKLETKPEKVFFTDDKEENVLAASQLGLKSVRYIDNEQIMRELENLVQ